MILMGLEHFTTKFRCGKDLIIRQANKSGKSFVLYDRTRYVYDLANYTPPDSQYVSVIWNYKIDCYHLFINMKWSQ